MKSTDCTVAAYRINGWLDGIAAPRAPKTASRASASVSMGMRMCLYRSGSATPWKALQVRTKLASSCWSRCSATARTSSRGSDVPVMVQDEQRAGTAWGEWPAHSPPTCRQRVVVRLTGHSITKVHHSGDALLEYYCMLHNTLRCTADAYWRNWFAECNRTTRKWGSHVSCHSAKLRRPPLARSAFVLSLLRLALPSLSFGTRRDPTPRPPHRPRRLLL